MFPLKPKSSTIVGLWEMQYRYKAQDKNFKIGFMNMIEDLKEEMNE